MVFTPAIVAAVANAVSGSRTREGIGRVERQTGPDSYIVSLGREKMTITVTSGTLAAGERVNVTAQGLNLVIERLDEAKRRPANARTDSFLHPAAGSPEKLKGILDTIVLSLTQGQSDAAALRQSETLFSSMAPGYTRIDAGLTATISGLLGTIARSEGASADMIASAVTLIEQLKGKIDINDPTLSSNRIMITGRALPEGMFSFSSVEEALRFLGKDAAGDPALAAQLRNSLDTHGVIILSIRVCAAQESVLVLLGPDDVLRELESWKGSVLQSRMFKSVPADVFARVFADRGTIPLDYLRLLDTFASALQLPAVSAKAGSRDAQVASLVQWLHAAADSRAAPASLTPLAPVFSPASMIDALQDLAAAWSRMPGITVAIPPPEQFGLVAPALDKTGDRIGLIAFMVRALGLEFEQALASHRTPDTAGLKPFLLQLLHLIEPARPRVDTPQPVSATSTQAATLYGAVEESRQACLAIIDTMIGPAESSTSPDTRVPLERMAQGLREELRAFFTALLGRIDRQRGDLLQLLRGLAANTSTAQVLSNETFESFVRDVKERLNAFIRQSIAVLELTVQRQAPQYVTHAPSGATSETASTPLTAMPWYTAELEKSLQTLLARLDLFRPQVISMVDTVLREALHENMARMGVDGKSGTASPHPAVPADPDTSPMVRQTVQANIETLLQRIESLQLLARQTPTASGEQQIISLPVKIGEVWTELQVRMIKQRRKGKRGSGDRQQYTVYINIAPPLLGPISVRLDYQVKKSLSIALEIEAAQTRAWFGRNRSALRESLIALGLPSPRIELFAPATRTPCADTASRPPSSTSIIDVQA